MYIHTCVQLYVYIYIIIIMEKQLSSGPYNSYYITVVSSLHMWDSFLLMMKMKLIFQIVIIIVQIKHNDIHVSRKSVIY